MDKFEQKISSQEQKESQGFSSIEFSLDALTSAEISAAEREQKKELSESKNNILDFFNRAEQADRGVSEIQRNEMENAFAPQNAQEWDDYGFIATYSDRDRSQFTLIENQFKTESELDAEIAEQKAEIRNEKISSNIIQFGKALSPFAVKNAMRDAGSEKAA